MKELSVFEAATARQTWALKMCFNEDFRTILISKSEASTLISNFNKGDKKLPSKYAGMFNKPQTSKAVVKVKAVVKTSKDVKVNKKVSELFAYMTSDSVSFDLISTMGAEFAIGGVISNDIDKSDKKKYLFLGGGCGFSFIKFDGRNKKIKSFVDESRDIKKKVEQYYMSLIDKNYLVKLEKSGNPIEAHFMQNLSYNTSYNYKVIHYLETLGFKKITATSMLD